MKILRNLIVAALLVGIMPADAYPEGAGSAMDVCEIKENGNKKGPRLTSNDDSGTVADMSDADDAVRWPASMVTGTLPVMYIVCDDREITSKDLHDKDYRDAEYYIDAMGLDGMDGVGSADKMLPLEIKARGNYTRNSFSKKPYKIKLDKKQNLLGLTEEKSKHYALLAHADDALGYLRDFVAFNLGARMKDFLPWTPKMQPIELVINDEYRGIYFLTESIRIQEGRVDIVEGEDNETDNAKISGGYIVEIDNYHSETNQIHLMEHDRSVDVSADTPEEWSPIQYDFIYHQFSMMNDLIHANDDELWSYMDLDAAAAYYVVMEIIDNWEAYCGSTYLYRDYGHDKKWIFSPIWDCGNAFRRADANNSFLDATEYDVKWIPYLVRNEKFMDKVKAIWRWFWATQTDGFFDDISRYVEDVTEAAIADAERWRDAPLPELYYDEYLGGYNNPSPVSDNSAMYVSHFSLLKSLDAKINWLSEEWGEPDMALERPERDDTPAASLPPFADPDQSGSSAAIVELHEDKKGKIEIYHVGGTKISEVNTMDGLNVSPGVYVIKKDEGASKVIVR